MIAAQRSRPRGCRFGRAGLFDRARPWLAAAIVTLSAAAPAAAQWNTESPSPTYLDVRGVGVFSSQHVFIATADDSFDDGGALWESTDGGASWVQRDVPFSLGSPLNGLFFLDDQTGWVCGNANYRTTDAGATWTELPVLGSIYSMEFFTSSLGIARSNLFFYLTYDAGDSWIPTPDDIFDLSFTDATAVTGIGVSPSGLHRTTDGAASFSHVLSGDAKAVRFLSSTVGVAIVDTTHYRTTDAGATWTAGALAEGRRRLDRVSADVVLAWRPGGLFPPDDERVFRSEDGGQTWTDLGEIMPAGVWGFTVIDAQTIVAADLEGSMFRSTDAGQTWSQTYTSPGPRPGFLSSALPAFADASTGYFGFGAGFVIGTSDGGASWTQVSSGTGQTLNDIARFPDGDMIAVGDNGALVTSAAASGSWTWQPAVTSFDLVAVHVVGPDEVVIVDEQAQVWKSSDGGVVWTAAGDRPTSLGPAEDVHFTTLLDGYVIGQGFSPATLYHTSDGGDSWMPVPGFLGAYVAADFEGQNGWAANVTGLFYRSTDDGVTWESGNLPGSPLSIEDMDFWDENVGYAVGNWGYAVRSSDGGASWEVLPRPTRPIG